MRSLDLHRRLDTILEVDNALEKSAELSQLATKVTGNAASGVDKDQKQERTQIKDNSAKSKADQLEKQYRQAEDDTKKAEDMATAKQDPNLLNKATSSRKRMETIFKSYNMARQQALGQPADPNKAEGIPPEAVGIS